MHTFARVHCRQLLILFVSLAWWADKDKERSKDKKKSDKHRSSSSSKIKDEPNHDNDSYSVIEPDAVAATKSEPMEEGECYDQDVPMHQEY